MRITSSMLSWAIRRPSRRWARSWALRRSYWVRRVKTSSWKVRYSSRTVSYTHLVYAAYELLKLKPGLHIAVLEMGQDIYHRQCPIVAGKVKECISCKPCSITVSYTHLDVYKRQSRWCRIRGPAAA